MQFAAENEGRDEEVIDKKRHRLASTFLTLLLVTSYACGAGTGPK